MSAAANGDTGRRVRLGRLTIGKVLAELGDDFPDVSASKIRYLEAEGLITPQRTASGYRTFSPADVQRLRYILSAQRDRFWPLKVIGEALDALDRGLTDPAQGPDARDGTDRGASGAQRRSSAPRPHVPAGRDRRRRAPTPRCRPPRACSNGIPSR